MLLSVSIENGTLAYHLTLTDHSGAHQFLTGNIIRMQANDNYTIVYLRGRRPFVVSKVLKIYEELLRPLGFIRTHRSHLINKQYVQRIEKSTIIMQDASVAEICRRKEKSVRQMLSQHALSKRRSLQSNLKMLRRTTVS
ncbi:MAG: LytTR family transcriptional regulator, partial [Hymenobacter sp.]